jgi:tripartite-type tricarboxylate transporter receptor subunit TctC
MKLPRRQFLHLVAGAAALPTMLRSAWAQAYPTRPVRLIVPIAPGGATDILARLMGHWLSERLGQQFVIDNRPGGGSNIGTEAVVRAPPDGYTLLLVSTTNTINATLYDRLNFDFLRDIAPVEGVLRGPYVMVVNPSVPAKSVPEFIAYAKANARKLSMASAGTGTGTHIAGEMFKLMAGVDMVHVPYRGGGPAFNDLLGGQVQVMFPTTVGSIEYIRAGRLRALAVTAGARTRYRTSRLWLSSCPTTRRASGSAWAYPGTRPPTLSTGSAERSTPALPIPRSRRGLPTWAARRFKARLPNLESSLQTTRKSGAR